MNKPVDVLERFRWADSGASDSDIRAAQRTLRMTLPADYAAVLRRHNGGKGWIGDGRYLDLWSIEQVVESNQTLDAATFVPDTLLIGSDGGGELYGVQCKDDTERFARYPAVGLSLKEGVELGDSWHAFLRALAENR